MKMWASDHPKAKLIARKRAAILEAARGAFLSTGYEGTSMEAIAAAAGVSIMTLYRHAESKDGLFASVMLNECARAHGPENPDAISLDQPVRAVLIEAGLRFQDRIASAETISLFRTVITEAVKFPHVAKAAYRGFIGGWEREVADFLAARSHGENIDAIEYSELAAGFIDDLVGAEFLRCLFGIAETASAQLRMQRAQSAADQLLACLASLPPDRDPSEPQA
ncbi:TetR/AcrR family transcriptional regulator [Paraburkholderia tropica]|uniref:TetR/AcrR family transcriptional regulator n=1 Tax=Paraburkholderia tropica TaxID=92647 RepID=UPI0007ED129A|nr:TetR/AcrR family transcriptional regulator [Paraburkholderia tropica]OBR54717.1 hypothetical protein A6456_37905 [Paraburkholderia tropica]